MLITHGNLDALRTTLSLAFKGGYDVTETKLDKLATPVPSSTRTNTYAWLALQIALREWLGSRVAANLKEHRAELANKSYEGTIEVDRDDIEDDNLGIYTSMLAPQLGQATKKHPDILFKELVQSNSGNGPTMWDGKALFATDHPTFDATGTTYTNKFTLSLTADNFNTVWSTMSAYTGENGQPLAVSPTLLVVPPQLKKQALSIMQSTTAAVPVMNVGGTENVGGAAIDNVLKGWAEVLIIEELANDPTRWFLMDVSRPIKPFIHQMRRAAQFVSRLNPDDPKAFDAKKFTYGVDGRWAVGATLPFLVATSKP